MATDSAKLALDPAGSPSARAQRSDSPDPNDTLPRAFGRYVLLRRIARGGMGEVFLASTTGVEGAERPVVVKVIRRDHATDPSFIARFLDEARVQAQLQHSGVAQVLEAAIDPETGEPYAVVEYVEGKSLGDLRSRAVQIGKQLPWADAVAVATLIAEALAHVHERKDASGQALAIVHRDLSPQNVMIGYGGDAKIIDFGTARGQNRRCHTVSGVVFAKPGYVAPEVANGDPGDAKVDVYALGVMLWELCAGRRFLQGDANVHMAAVARNGRNPPPLSAINGGPPELDKIIERLCSFDKAARPTSRAAALDLAKLLVEAPPLASGERSIRARTATLMESLFAGEPGTSRREFSRLVAAAQTGAARREPTPSGKSRTSIAPDAEPKPARDPRPGEVVGGTRWRIKREIGRGASSVVYEAEHLDLGRQVALKLLAAEQSRSKEFAERFRREARALSHLSHENLIGVVDVGVTAEGRLFCVMELLDGETLESYLAREKGYDWREALAVADQALAALEVAHAANLVHRDIKPANIFLTHPSGVKLLDFGLAKGASDAVMAPQKEFKLFGTVEYMAPEQAGGGQVDARADLYALGCVLYEILTGQLPFTGDGAMAILDAKKKGSPEKLRDRAPTRGIPRRVDELVLRALSRHASARFQTATEMRRAVSEAITRTGSLGVVRRFGGYAALGVAVAALAVAAGGRWAPLRGFVGGTAAHYAADSGESEALAFDPSAGVINPDDSWARAEQGEDPLEPLEAELAPPPAEEATATPEPAAEEPAPKPARATPRKRKSAPRDAKAQKTAKSTAKPKDKKPAEEPSIDDKPAKSLEAADAVDPDKTARSKTKRRKKKSRVAHVE